MLSSLPLFVIGVEKEFAVVVVEGSGRISDIVATLIKKVKTLPSISELKAPAEIESHPLLHLYDAGMLLTTRYFA